VGKFLHIKRNLSFSLQVVSLAIPYCFWVNRVSTVATRLHDPNERPAAGRFMEIEYTPNLFHFHIFRRLSQKDKDTTTSRDMVGPKFFLDFYGTVPWPKLFPGFNNSLRPCHLHHREKKTGRLYSMTDFKDNMLNSLVK